MKEKIAVRIEEVQAWSSLMDSLEVMESGVRADMEDYSAQLKEEYPNGGKEMESSWRYKSLQTCKAKLKAYENICAVILKAMG